MIKKFLNRPYPFSYQPSRRIKQLIPVGFFVFAFLTFFKPFGLGNDPDFIQTAAYLSFSGTMTGLLTTVLIPYLFPAYFNESKWTLKRNLIWNTWVFFIFATLMFIAFNIYVIYRYNNFSNFTFNTYLWWVYINLIFGLPLGIMINLFNQYYLLKKYIKVADVINNGIETSGISGLRSTSDYLLEFKIDKYKKVQILVENIIYVEALGNYINVVYEQNGIQKVTIRETINNLQQRTNFADMIYRSHRSYLVNLNYIINVSGDAQGLKVHFRDINTAVPVSRNKIKEFRLLASSKK